jgi:hypothetical protein
VTLASAHCPNETESEDDLIIIRHQDDESSGSIGHNSSGHWLLRVGDYCCWENVRLLQK